MPGTSRPGLTIIVVLLVICAISCGPKAVRIQALAPARAVSVTGLQRIAVLPFHGNMGHSVTPRVESLLAEIQVQNRPYFTMVDRTRIGHVLEEQRFALDSAVDPRMAVRVGKLVGAQAILDGEAMATSSDRHYREKVQACIRSDADGFCAEWGEKSVSCTERTASAEVRFRLVEAVMGTVAYSKPISDVARASRCAEDEPLPEAGRMIARCMDNILQEFRKDIAPHRYTLSMRLMKADSVVKSDKVLLKRFNGALDYSNAGQISRACEIWTECQEDRPDSVALQYNLGVCAEVAGDFDQAERLYRQADELRGRPDERIIDAMRRVDQRRQDTRRLEKQLNQDR